jgi:hypothetical protein
MILSPWGKEVEESYDFDVTKADKLFLTLLTTKNVHFVKLLKCVTDFTIVFLSSRWLKNIYGMSNLGSG